MAAAWTVFVVDDDAISRALLRGMLKKAHYHFEEFASAVDFLKAYQTHPRPGCVVLDSVMPVMTGPQLHERLLELKIRLPIIMVTSQAEIPLAVQAGQRGAIDYLIKPPKPPELLAAIREAQVLHRDGCLQDVQNQRTRELIATLSRRQRQLLELHLKGLDCRREVVVMGVASNTVRNHRHQLLKKMEADSLHDLIRNVLLAHE